ncbi:MAG: hypothetical protein IJ754_02725 [Bacteroidaceae bacterium]|nr:hypothetical protein [Bacteroidaceae bacterium]
MWPRTARRRPVFVWFISTSMVGSVEICSIWFSVRILWTGALRARIPLET